MTNDRFGAVAETDKTTSDNVLAWYVIDTHVRMAGGSYHDFVVTTLPVRPLNPIRDDKTLYWSEPMAGHLAREIAIMLNEYHGAP